MDKGQGVDSFGFAFGRRPSTSSLGDGRCHLVAGRFVKVARNGFAFAVAAVVIGIDEPTPTIKHDEVQTKQVARTRLLVRSRVAAHVADNVGQGHDVILGQRQRLDFAQLALQLDVRDDGSQLLLSKLVDRMATRKKLNDRSRYLERGVETVHAEAFPFIALESSQVALSGRHAGPFPLWSA